MPISQTPVPSSLWLIGGLQLETGRYYAPINRGREGWREDGMEGGWDGGREEGREGGRDGGRE